MSAQRASQLVEAGLWLRLSGDNEGAKRLFEQALKLDPTNARARQLLDTPVKSAHTPPPGAPKNPFERREGPTGGAAADLDWGLATGYVPTPPPIAPAGSTQSKPGAPPNQRKPEIISPFTVRLGETFEPAPERPRDEPMAPDPQDEVTIEDAALPIDEPLEPLPSSGTMVFGGAMGIPVPPPSMEVPSSGTMVFNAPSPMPETSSPYPVAPSNTLVFGGGQPITSSPDSGPLESSGTMVFGGMQQLEQQEQPESETLVYGGSKSAPPTVPPLTPYGSNTMTFGMSAAKEPQGSPIGQAHGSSTMVFGSGSSLPPSIAPVAPAMPVASYVPPAVSSVPPPTPTPPEPIAPSNTLTFNFDDMVAPTLSRVPPPVAPDGPQTAWDKSNPRIDIAAEIQEGEGGGFDLISSDPPPAPKARSQTQLRDEVQTLLSGAKDLLDLDDHSGAMELISKALELDPQDADAIRLKDRSEKTLQAMYESKLGDLNQTPRVKLKDDEIIWLNLDHRAGFVLAQIDGSVTFEDVFAVSGMSRLDTGRILAQLVEEGVITRG